jgi:hypothetical protein
MEASDLTVLSCIHCDASPGRRVLCVARSATDAQQLGELIDEGDTRIVFATVEDALLRLTTGELYDLVLCERGASLEGEFRERLSRLAPESVPRTFTVPLPVSRS